MLDTPKNNRRDVSSWKLERVTPDLVGRYPPSPLLLVMLWIQNLGRFCDFHTLRIRMQEILNLSSEEIVSWKK